MSSPENKPQPENNPTVPQPMQVKENSPLMGPKSNSKLKRVSEALKLTIICLGVIAITVGYHGHYDSPLKTMLKSKAFEKTCQTEKESDKTTPTCPTGSVEMEMSFISVVTIFLILSVIIFILGTVINFGDMKALVYLDIYYHFVAGVLVIFVANMMITSGDKLDKFIVEQMDPASWICHNGSSNLDLRTCPCFSSSGSNPIAGILDKYLGNCFIEVVVPVSNEITTTCSTSDPQCQDYIKQSNNQPPIIKSGKQSGLPLGIDVDDVHSSRLAELRNFVKFHYKTAAGIIAALNGMVYIVVGLLAQKGLRGEIVEIKIQYTITFKKLPLLD